MSAGVGRVLDALRHGGPVLVMDRENEATSCSLLAMSLRSG
jgi:hypothetical protein